MLGSFEISLNESSINDQLCGFIRKACSLPCFDLFPHGFEVPLHPVDSDPERMSTRFRCLLSLASTGVNTPETILPSWKTSGLRVRGRATVESRVERGSKITLALNLMRSDPSAVSNSAGRSRWTRHNGTLKRGSNWSRTRVVKNPKCLIWCRTGATTRFSSPLNCPYVVPRIKKMIEASVLLRSHRVVGSLKAVVC